MGAILRVAMLIIIVASIRSAVGSEKVKNVLRNGCFDLGDDPVTLIPHGWDAPQEMLSPERVDHSTRLKAHSPPGHLWGASTPVSSLRQVILISELRASTRTRNRWFVQLSFHHTSFHISDDAVNATVYYSTVSTEKVEAIKTPILFSREERVWQAWRSEWVELPSGTDSLVVEVGCVRYVNQNCDGYLDDVCLYLALLPPSDEQISDKDFEIPDTCECVSPNVTLSSLFFEEDDEPNQALQSSSTSGVTTLDPSAELRIRYVHILLVVLAIVTLIAVLIKRRELKVQHTRRE